MQNHIAVERAVVPIIDEARLWLSHWLVLADEWTALAITERELARILKLLRRLLLDWYVLICVFLVSCLTLEIVQRFLLLRLPLTINGLLGGRRCG